MVVTYYLILNGNNDVIPVRTGGYGELTQQQATEKYLLDPIWFGRVRAKAQRAIDWYAENLSNLLEYQNLRIVEVTFDTNTIVQQLAR
jgi:hypothetical protein